MCVCLVRCVFAAAVFSTLPLVAAQAEDRSHRPAGRMADAGKGAEALAHSRTTPAAHAFADHPVKQHPASGALVIGQPWPFDTGTSKGTPDRFADAMPAAPANTAEALQAMLQLAALWTF